MANAAAKKASAAQGAAAKTYTPIFGGVNALYLLIKFVFSSSSSYTIWSYAGIVVLVGLNWFCYKGILDSAAETSSSSSSDLVGGGWLDVVAVIWIIQFGTALWSPSMYWGLVILPPWGAYNIYNTMKGGGGTPAAKGSNQADSAEDVSEELQERRQKRSERRRQKRA